MTLEFKKGYMDGLASVDAEDVVKAKVALNVLADTPPLIRQYWRGFMKAFNDKKLTLALAKLQRPYIQWVGRKPLKFYRGSNQTWTDLSRLQGECFTTKALEPNRITRYYFDLSNSLFEHDN